MKGHCENFSQILKHFLKQREMHEILVMHYFLLGGDERLCVHVGLDFAIKILERTQLTAFFRNVERKLT